MITLVKALVVLVATALAGCGASFLYGTVAHFFDLFIVFPFIVAAVIVSAGSTIARWVKFNQGVLLVLIGIVLGVAAYPAYLSGKYAMLVTEFVHGSPALLTNFSFKPDTFTTIQELTPAIFESARERADAALQQQVGQDGIVGQMLLNMRTGIPVRTKQLGEGDLIFGSVVELFKFGVLVVVSGSALRDTVKDRAIWGGGKRDKRGQRTTKRRLSAEEEEIWGKGE